MGRSLLHPTTCSSSPIRSASSYQAVTRFSGPTDTVRSDVRAELRTFFEVNRHYVVLAALTTLANEGTVPREMVKQAIDKYGIDPEKPNPVTV